MRRIKFDVSPNPGHDFCQDSLNSDGNCFATKRRSIIRKMDSLHLLLKNNPFDVFTVSETWLNSSIDRGGKSSSGCMIYVRDGLPYRVRPDLQDENIECCVMEVTRSKCKKLFIWTIYIQPLHGHSLGGFIDILN